MDDDDLWPQEAHEQADSFWWNIWRNRNVGWNLQEGDTVLQVATFRDARRVIWQFEAAQVAHIEADGWLEVTEAISRHTRIPVRTVRNDYYAREKRELDAGKALVWRGIPVKRLDMPFPESLRFQRNGWLVMEPAELRTNGIRIAKRGRMSEPAAVDTPSPERSTRPRKGQGRLDVESRLAVERRAMEVATAWCRRQKWTAIQDTSARQPWDLEATDPQSGRRRYVEVKGLTGEFGAVDITAGELKAARKHGRDHALVVVFGIGLKVDDSGVVRAAGGKLTAFDPWEPTREELSETRYRWLREHR